VTCASNPAPRGIDLVEGGQIGICGPAHLSVLKSAFADGRPRYRTDFTCTSSKDLALTIYTPPDSGASHRHRRRAARCPRRVRRLQRHVHPPRISGAVRAEAAAHRAERRRSADWRRAPPHGQLDSLRIGNRPLWLRSTSRKINSSTTTRSQPARNLRGSAAARPPTKSEHPAPARDCGNVRR